MSQIKSYKKLADRQLSIPSIYIINDIVYYLLNHFNVSIFILRHRSVQDSIAGSTSKTIRHKKDL